MGRNRIPQSRRTDQEKAGRDCVVGEKVALLSKIEKEGGINRGRSQISARSAGKASKR